MVAAAGRPRPPTVASICHWPVRLSPVCQTLGQLCLLVKTGLLNLPRDVARPLQRSVDATAGIHARTCRATAIESLLTLMLRLVHY